LILDSEKTGVDKVLQVNILTLDNKNIA